MIKYIAATYHLRTEKYFSEYISKFFIAIRALLTGSILGCISSPNPRAAYKEIRIVCRQWDSNYRQVEVWVRSNGGVRASYFWACQEEEGSPQVDVLRATAQIWDTQRPLINNLDENARRGEEIELACKSASREADLQICRLQLLGVPVRLYCSSSTWSLCCDPVATQTVANVSLPSSFNSLKLCSFPLSH